MEVKLYLKGTEVKNIKQSLLSYYFQSKITYTFYCLVLLTSLQFIDVNPPVAVWFFVI